MRTDHFLSSGKMLVLAGSIAMLAFSACQKTTRDEIATDETAINRLAMPTPPISSVPNQLIVKFKSGVSQKTKGNSLLVVDGQIEETILTASMQRSGNTEGVFLVHTAMDVNAAIAKLKADDRVEYAEPNYIYHHAATSNDTYYTNGSLWGMYGATTTPANQYGSRAGQAWASGNTGSATVIVGIIDEGVMNAHEDLSANMWVNPFDAADGIDNDGNGYIDDIYGWDFAGNNNSTFDGLSDDHGTHVAGTIGAKGGNGIGVAGVCWDIRMISAKFLGSNGGTTANAIKAVDYITDLKTRHGINIVATNNSWGGGGFSQALQDAIERANTAGILFIAAAGNNGVNIDASASYPAGYPNSNIVSVAAITSTGTLASYSNYGATKVDLGAPGSGVTSTLPVRSKGSVGSGYGSYSGTSMATPHVTGAAALYAASHPGATAAQIRNAILSSVISTNSLNGKTVTGGRLNASGF